MIFSLQSSFRYRLALRTDRLRTATTSFLPPSPLFLAPISVFSSFFFHPHFIVLFIVAAEMQYPRVNQYPDDVFVRLPAYYPDHSGPGWYTELQCPQQAHLAVQYSSALRKDVYIQPKAFCISRIKEELGKEGIREILYSFGAERGVSRYFHHSGIYIS